MPADTLVVVGIVVAAFVFFAGTLLFADLTWEKPTPKR